MSERGSFVTEYVYCGKCFEAAKKWLLASDKGLNSLVVGEVPIIAGKLGGLYAGEEVHSMEFLLNDLGADLCDGHRIRVCVIPDSGPPQLLTCRAWRVEVATEEVKP